MQIIIKLKKNRLCLIEDNKNILLSFPIIYGRNSAKGTKKEEGDEKTPRGKYYICTINKKSKFTLFLGISYPGKNDATQALKEKKITQKEYEKIIFALKEKKRPLWKTSLGGEVGIHGGGIKRDGTRGCIALKDEDILKLGKYITLGMSVTII